ncbi:MAG TPA: type I restriction endonuclease, partial [Geothrix sp.]|nr:type I restriction endonuclease [Geothrix sp.]
MTAPESISKLVEKYESLRSEYKADKYNEAQLRREFLDPFFEALGWDMSNQQDWAGKWKEVIYEASVDVEGAAKAADYAFRFGGTTVFFLEAKKPSVNIELKPESAFQLRRYGWSAKLPASVLSNFEHLAVYDCSIRPNKNDKASVCRIKLYSYQEYIEKWDEIASILHKNSVGKGLYELHTKRSKTRKGTAEVDTEFLKEIEHWRELLAKNVALRNHELGTREINNVVQLTIDRIIFLRICEDRGIEPDGKIKTIASGTNLYSKLVELFSNA